MSGRTNSGRAGDRRLVLDPTLASRSAAERHEMSTAQLFAKLSTASMWSGWNAENFEPEWVVM